MNARLAVVLSGSLLVSAAGGLIATVPTMRTAQEAVRPVERAPTPELEARRLAVLAMLRSTSDMAADQVAQLELLAGLLAEASRRRDRPSRETRSVGAALGR